jgi:hypothetical protein
MSTLPTSNLTESTMISASQILFNKKFVKQTNYYPLSSNITELGVVSAYPQISYVKNHNLFPNATRRDVTLIGNFLYVDNIYLSAANNSLFNLSVIYMDYFTESNLLSLRYQQSTIDRLTLKYPPFSGIEISSYSKISDTRISVTLPPLSNFEIGDVIAIITKNGSGYYCDTSITVIGLPSATPSPTVTPTPTPAIANCLVVNGSNNEFAIYGDYSYTFAGLITYTIFVNNVTYVVTDNIIQYTSNTNPFGQITYLPSLNGWYLQGINAQNQQLNIAYIGTGLSYDVTSQVSILTGGGTINVALNSACTPTPTPTPTVTRTLTPTPTPTPSN